ncbi:MAG: hypothetical protein AB3N13_10720 [Arenibacterium sp.]
MLSREYEFDLRTLRYQKPPTRHAIALDAYLDQQREHLQRVGQGAATRTTFASVAGKLSTFWRRLTPRATRAVAPQRRGGQTS